MAEKLAAQQNHTEDEKSFLISCKGGCKLRKNNTFEENGKKILPILRSLKNILISLASSCTNFCVAAFQLCCYSIFGELATFK
jgi:hypothetical protein